MSQVDISSRDPRHAEWVRAFNGVLDGMKRYVMELHTTGLVWNASVSIHLLLN
jgi:adenylyl cyclase-associated protein